MPQAIPIYLDSFELPARKDERRDAIMALLRLPDPPDLRGPCGHRRRYKYHYGGDKLRQPAIRLALAQAYWQRSLTEARGDNGGIVSVRRGVGSERSVR